MCSAVNRPRSSECLRRETGECLDTCTVEQPTVIFRASASFVLRMLGHVHVGQPTVILRVSARFSCACLDMCSARATDRDLESVSSCFSCECLDMSSGNRP